MENVQCTVYTVHLPFKGLTEHQNNTSIKLINPFTLVFLPITQNIFRQTIPENSGPDKTFCCECPYEKKKKKKFRFTPSQSTLKYGSKNRPWPKGLKNK